MGNVWVGLREGGMEGGRKGAESAWWHEGRRSLDGVPAAAVAGLAAKNRAGSEERREGGRV